jgi:phage terminase small subunit
MRKRRGQVTPKEAAFTKAYARLGDATEAAAKAGYNFPAQAAYQLKQRPEIIKEAERLSRGLITDEIIPLALGRMVRDLKAPTTATKDVVAIFKAVAPYGFTDVATHDKELHERTAQELDAIIQQAEARLKELEAPILELEAEDSIFD